MKIIHKIRYQMTKEDYAFIKPQLKAKHIKIREIAEKVGVSKQFVSDVLSGRGYINKDILEVLQENGINVLFSHYYEDEKWYFKSQVGIVASLLVITTSNVIAVKKRNNGAENEKKHISTIEFC